MTFRKSAAMTSKINENQFRQLFLNPWHMLSSIWVHFGLWRPATIAEIWIFNIFPASAWSPYQSLFLKRDWERSRGQWSGGGRLLQRSQLLCVFASHSLAFLWSRIITQCRVWAGGGEGRQQCSAYSGGREWLADLPAGQVGDPSGRWQNFNHFMTMIMRGAESWDKQRCGGTIPGNITCYWTRFSLGISFPKPLA